MKHINVATAVIVNKRRKILCYQRVKEDPLSLSWELPSFKIEAHDLDNEIDKLTSEINKKFDIEIEIVKTIGSTKRIIDEDNTEVSTNYYDARVKTGRPEKGEYKAVKWANIPNIMNLSWVPADKPALNRIMNYLIDMGPAK